MKQFSRFALLFLLFLAACSKTEPESAEPPEAAEAKPGTFADDLAFLRAHGEVVVLSATEGDGSAQVVVSPNMQGRVLTSTLAGADGLSLGWINRDLIASGDTLLHINPLGGEDRFWMGPEGGQFSIFFSADDPFDVDHWFTPAGFDSEPFEVFDTSPSQVAFRKHLSLMNYSGTAFDVEVDRTVRLLGRVEAGDLLGIALDDSVKSVAFESDNTIKNVGENAWTEETGLVSIWILGMFNPSPTTTVVIPFREGADAELGPVVNDAYFGKVPADRLIVQPGVIFFRGDGEYRSKIGLSPARATSIAGSYDSSSNVLTIVQYTKPEGVTRYVNSMWEHQDAPYAGDVLNSYNDGPLGPGEKGLGPFYELETSSPAAALAPNETLTHVHRTFHFEGPESSLNSIAQQLLGVSIEQIREVF